MIYLDNAATTFPKPPGVLSAMNDALTLYGANPGRGGYPLAQAADRRLYDCRRRAAAFFGLGQTERMIYTPGCTWAINTVLKGCLNPGDHVIISDLEHNAVVRPLKALESKGVTVTRAHISEGDPEETMRSFRAAVRRNTKMVFCTHASNVFGIMPPVSMLGKMCRQHGILFGIDAAQAAGTEYITADNTSADFICAPAHKGLYGVMGLGLLALCGSEMPEPLIQGGTGTLSAHREQPEDLPDRYESGTPCMPAICALDEGLRTVEQKSVSRIRSHELSITCHIYDELRRTAGVELYTRRPCAGTHVPVLSFNIGDMTGEEAAERLAEQGICVRAGYHCAFDAHTVFGTHRRGTVRVSPSMFTTHKDAESLLRAVRNCIK